MAEAEITPIKGSEFELQLTPVDQRSTVAYLRTMLCFQLPQDHSQDYIITLLQLAAQRLVDQIPWLASTLVPNPDVSARAKDPFVVVPGSVDLRIRRPVLDLNISGLKSTECRDDLWPARPQTKLFGCNIQANCIRRDGLLLGFAINHALADGCTHAEIIRHLAAQCVAIQAADRSLAVAPFLPVCFGRTAFARTQPADIVPEVPDFNVLPAVPTRHGSLFATAASEQMSIDEVFRNRRAGL